MPLHRRGRWVAGLDLSVPMLARYRAKALPIAGALLKEDDRGEQQMSLL